MSTTSDKIHEYFSTFPKRTYPKGQIIIFANENPDAVYYLVEGRVRSYDHSYRGDEVTVNIFKPAAFFPMSWAINHTPNQYFYRTEEPTILHVVPADKALEFVKANPDVMLDLLSRLYHGIDGLLGRMVHLMSGTARSRVMYELIIECRRFGINEKANAYELKVSEVDLAARSGLSRETVSREISKLKEQKIIATGSKLIVEDLAELEKMLGMEL
ncbi:Crp/Fnr family transcriptional regulator [soil metagenome]